jgi:cation transport ATPase
MTTQRITMPISDLGGGGSGARMIERAVAGTPGVLSAYVNPALEMAYITFDPERCTADQVSAAVAACRVHAEPDQAPPTHDRTTPTFTAHVPEPTAAASRLASRIKLAELTGGIGAGVLGAGLALLLPVAAAAYATPILILGALMHGWGMLDKHRLERSAGASRPVWAEALYWGCWLALLALGSVVVFGLRR